MLLRRFPALFWMGLTLLLLAVIGLSLTWKVAVPLSDLWSADPDARQVAQQIFWEIRPQRVVAALLVGASLSVSGAALQSLFRNPLAEPYLLGISAGGALGATLAAALRLPSWNGFEAGAFLAFGGALAASALVYALGQNRGGSLSDSSLSQSSFSTDRARLLLCGVALSAFLSALMSVVVTLSGSIELAQQISFWLLGGLTRASWAQNGLLLLSLSVGIALLLGCARDLNALRAGEEDAASLGVEMAALHRRILIAVSLMSAASVAAAGLIGFVGLLAPHLMRLLGGRDARVLLPGAALLGALLLCGCDTLARGIRPPLELPVGIVTALLGVPLFVFLARRE